MKIALTPFMKTYYVDAAPAVVEKAWREFQETLSVPGDKLKEVRFEPIAGEPERTRLCMDDGAQDDGDMRRFRGFLDDMVLGR